MMNAGRNRWALMWVVCVGLCGCQSVGTRGSDASPAAADRSPGYVLLYELCKKQSRAGQAFWIVSAHDQTKQAVRAVADLSQQMAETIEVYAEEASPPIALDAAVLPDAEVRARGRIESDTRSAILTGGHSERALILAQIDATAYAAALARVLAEDSDRQPMQEALVAFAEAMDQQHDALTRQLAVRPGEAAGEE